MLNCNFALRSCARRWPVMLSCFVLAAGLFAPATYPQAAPRKPESGKRPQSLVIRNAMLVDGNGTPASGPKDILIEGNLISRIVPLDPVALKQGTQKRPEAAAEIDAGGRYVLPGLINSHAHLQDERASIPMPFEYQLKLWLASGITTIRDVGSDIRKALALRQQSLQGSIAAPRIFVYGRFNYPPAPLDTAEARARVGDLQRMGVDGIKLFGIDRDLMSAMAEEARQAGLRIAHHVGVEETNAWDDIACGITSIEHWYGIPDAALGRRVQNFPPEYNYSNETDRFRYAGRLWREADQEKLLEVLDGLAAARVAWVPTLNIYEASRDLLRAQNQPWFSQYLHPALEEYFRPNPGHHGSYFIGWTSADEAFWKENYRLWMKALVEFARRGGLIGAGEDAGFIYQMYGFGFIRELELHQEAGFHPITVIQHATGNNARILGQENRLGRLRSGFLADLIVVNGNPLEDLKVLYPTGVEVWRDGRSARSGGVEWVIKDGIPYHGPSMMAEVAQLVADARSAGAGEPGAKPKPHPRDSPP